MFRIEYERPISAMNNKTCSETQRRRGKEQSRLLDRITKTFMIRRLQKDTVERHLPPRTEVFVFCRPTKLQCQLYREMTRHHTGSPDPGATADALTTLINLRKLCSHPSLVEEEGSGNSTSVAVSGKLKTLDMLLTQMRKEAPQDKVIIVSNFTTALSLIEDSILNPRGLSFVRLDGTTDISNRQQIVDTFNRTSSQRSFAFLLSSKAGGCGLNLIGGK
jgi:SNF2 family DNA or RNA helicase